MELVSELMHGLINNLEVEKEKVLREKFSEKGFGHLLDENIVNRFKRVLVERSGKFERWYADDFTPDGVLIVTFIIEPTMVSMNNGFNVGMDINYF